jgi:hypothetical protein
MNYNNYFDSPIYGFAPPNYNKNNFAHNIYRNYNDYITCKPVPKLDDGKQFYSVVSNSCYPVRIGNKICNQVRLPPIGCPGNCPDTCIKAPPYVQSNDCESCNILKANIISHRNIYNNNNIPAIYVPNADITRRIKYDLMHTPTRRLFSFNQIIPGKNIFMRSKYINCIP